MDEKQGLREGVEREAEVEGKSGMGQEGYAYILTLKPKLGVAGLELYPT